MDCPLSRHTEQVPAHPDATNSPPTTASTSITSSSPTPSFIGNPILSSTYLTSDNLPLPSFLVTPDDSDDDSGSVPHTPHLSDYQLPSFLLHDSLSANNPAPPTPSLHLTSILADSTSSPTTAAASTSAASTVHPTLTHEKVEAANLPVLTLWNINAAVEYNEPRTNNASEGGNTALSNAFSSNHPTIWVFIETLAKFHTETETKYLQIASGGNPAEKARRKWRIREQKLRNLVQNYNPARRLDFCREIGYNYY